ncbi:MAG: hypothetical protein SNF33_00475 [Candidatus Algichlamydia australiensis]|nr:hypothetical protein [Chlamydiales bacterium]
MELDEISPISPLQFFSFSYPVPFAKKFPEKGIFTEPYLLPCMAEFLGEEAFADVAFFWNEKGIEVVIKVDKKRKEGDQIELFFDTRDRKDLGFLNRYCHHFLFTTIGEEVTRLRADQLRELAKPDQLQIAIEESTKSHKVKIRIDAEALFGFAPKEFARLGFTYIIKNGEELQHFSVSSKDHAVASHPSLWASILMRKLENKR